MLTKNMSLDLEKMQQLHQALVSNSHNFSGSNDPQRITEDATEQLLLGAKAIAEGRRLGMSDDDTLSAMTQMYQ